MTKATSILVTGATGKLGTAVCQTLVDQGYSVHATDLKYAKGLPVRVEVGDLRDEVFAYRVLEGNEVVVHLANHPNQFAGPSPQTLLAENVAINANVFHAAVDLGIGCIVFASSVQAMLKRGSMRQPPPYDIPYLPLDGAAPTNPGANTYALSKEFAERMLRLAVEMDPSLCATAIRYPMLVTEMWARRMAHTKRLPIEWVDFTECTAHLFLADAASLVANIIRHRLPGYHQYFPAQTMELRGYPVSDIIRDRYANVTLLKPVSEIDSLIDVSAISRELGWSPTQRISVELER